MNQILVSKRIIVTKEMKKKKRTYKLIYTLSILTIAILIIYYVFAENGRNLRENIGKEILSSVGDTSTVADQAIVIALDDNNENEIVPLESTADDQAVTSTVTASDGSNYNTEAIVSYPKLGISYPVLADESDALLKVSVCKYWGPKPNEVGNYCIVGHNYKSGKMFGKLSMAQNGDQVILKDLSGKSVTYGVYNIYKVDPTDVTCTSQLTNGKKEVTLITCTNFGKERLVIKAREI